MDLSTGFNLTESEVTRLYLLDWIYDNGGSRPGTFLALGPLFKDA